MWKHPAAIDIDRLAANLHPNVRNDGGRTKWIIVRGPGADMSGGEEILHQSPISTREGKATTLLTSSGRLAAQYVLARGWFRIRPDGTFEFGRTSTGNLSTVVHEPAHGCLKMINHLAGRADASDTLQRDYQTIRDFLGAKDGEAFTREQQETWARANGRYLREGKAPSQKLKPSASNPSEGAE